MKTTLIDAIEYFNDNEPRGEYVLVLAGKDEKELKEEIQKSWDSYTIEEHMQMYIKEGLDSKAAMKKVAKDRGVSKRDIYAALHT